MRKNTSILVFIIATMLLFMLTACHTDTWEEHYDMGMKYLSEGNYEEAIVEFTAAIEIDDKNPEAFLGRAKSYMLKGGDFSEEAITDFKEVLSIDISITEAYFGLADIYQELGNSDRLFEILNKALENAPQEELESIFRYIVSAQ